MGSNNGQLYNTSVSFPGAKVYTSEILNHRPDGFNISSEANQSAGDLEATYTLEGYDAVLDKWIEEPLAVFQAHPVGAAIDTTDSFTKTHKKKYRVGIEPTGGTAGIVHMSWSHTF